MWDLPRIFIITSTLLACISATQLPTEQQYLWIQVTERETGSRLYIDDLQTFAKDENKQKNLLVIFKTYSEDIRMEFGIYK